MYAFITENSTSIMISTIIVFLMGLILWILSLIKLRNKNLENKEYNLWNNLFMTSGILLFISVVLGGLFVLSSMT
jgi:hypothetical protein